MGRYGCGGQVSCACECHFGDGDSRVNQQFGNRRNLPRSQDRRGPSSQPPFPQQAGKVCPTFRSGRRIQKLGTVRNSILVSESFAVLIVLPTFLGTPARHDHGGRGSMAQKNSGTRV